MSELLGRVGLAAFVLTLAAVVVATTGSGGLGGRLGGLFGYHGARLEAPVEPVTLKPVSAGGLAAASALPVHLRTAARLGTRRTKRRPDRAPIVPRRRPQPVAQPGPAPQPAAPSIPKPPPTPTPGGAVQQVEHTVQQVAAPAPAPVQQGVDQVVGTVNQACDAVGGCPSPPAASTVVHAVNEVLKP